MRLIIATNNAHKVTEIKAILGGWFDEVLSLKDAGIDIDVAEDADTFEGNALKKASEVFKIAAVDAAAVDAVLSDDSGLMVDALGGAPGVYSARYAGEGHDDAANNKKLLHDMQSVPEEARACRFVTAAALVRKDREPLIATGTVEGVLLRAPQGNNGFGYDPLFFYPPFGRSFAELTAEEKNSVSHRKRALEALKSMLESER